MKFFLFICFFLLSPQNYEVAVAVPISLINFVVSKSLTKWWTYVVCLVISPKIKQFASSKTFYNIWDSRKVLLICDRYCCTNWLVFATSPNHIAGFFITKVAFFSTAVANFVPMYMSNSNYLSTFIVFALENIFEFC